MNQLSEKIKMLYDPKLSVEANAERCEVSVPTINLWLRMNNVNRQYDSMLIRFKAIKKAQKQHPSWATKQISEITGYSFNTCKKYMLMEELEKPKVQDKISTIETNSKFIIRSISNDQQEILNNIIKLYIKQGYIQADFTFSKGVFYKDNNVIVPEYRFDKYPEQCEGVMDLSKADKVIEDGTLHSCIVDLPFLVTKKEWTKNCKMHQRFNSFDNMKEATEANKAMLKLSYDKLMKKGIMIMKTQDLFTAGHHIWMSHLVHQWAVEQGFKVIDKFILTSGIRMLSSGTNQKCARKYHSYFFVFKK